MTLSATSTAARQAGWTVAAFIGVFLFQRLAIPGLPISATVALLLIWCLVAFARGTLEIDTTRTVWWMVAAGVSCVLMVAQIGLVTLPLISVNSWLLWIVTWLPMVFRFTDRSPQAHLVTLRAISWAGGGLSALAMLFIGLQVVGVAYRDLLADLLPPSLLLDGFVITYPIFYGSPIYKANAWLALEPSFLSFMIGVAIVCALISRRHPLLLLWLGVGLLCTAAGSGIAVVGVYLIVVILRGRGGFLLRYAALALPVAALAATTVLGTAVIDRLGEATDTRSSTGLRAIEPYVHLVPQWLADPAKIMVGGGPGSSQRVVDDLGILGLLVPTPAKMMYDYGLVGGLMMLALVVVAYLRSPAPELAFALLFSMFTLQGAAQPLIAMSLLIITLFAPVGSPVDPAGVSTLAERVKSRPPQRVALP